MVATVHPGPPLPRAARRPGRPAALALALAALLGSPSRAAAEPAADGEADAEANTAGAASTPTSTSLPPLRRPLTLLFGVGPSIGINPNPCYGGYFYWDPLWHSGYYGLGCGGALKASQDLAYHFSGNATGPAIGVVVQEEFLIGGAYFGLAVAPKLSWDIQLLRGRGVYLTPSLAVGYHLLAWKGFPRVHAGEAQAGAAVKFAISENLLLWLQPAVFDFIFTPGFFIPRYDLLVGVGTVF